MHSRTQSLHGRRKRDSISVGSQPATGLVSLVCVSWLAVVGTSAESRAEQLRPNPRLADCETHFSMVLKTIRIGLLYSKIGFVRFADRSTRLLYRYVVGVSTLRYGTGGERARAKGERERSRRANERLLAVARTEEQPNTLNARAVAQCRPRSSSGRRRRRSSSSSPCPRRPTQATSAVAL